MKDDNTFDAPLDRAFAVLDYVAGQKKPVTAAEVAQELCLPLPSAHRLISNLEARDMIQRAPGTKRYGVGNRLVMLARRTISSTFRTARRHAVLQEVARELGEQCEIGIVRNNRVVYVDSVRVSPSQGLQFDPGSDAPIYCTSTGKIYLSRLPLRAREKLIRSLVVEQHTQRPSQTRTRCLRFWRRSASKDGRARTRSMSRVSSAALSRSPPATLP